MAKIDWIVIRTKYTTSIEPISYDKLAKEFGINPTSIGQKASEEGWVKMRQDTLTKIQEKTTEIATDNVATFQADKVKAGKYVIAKGLKGIEKHEPRNARESKELVETGYAIATQGMGLDNPKNQINIQNNNFITLDEFFKRMKDYGSEGTTGTV